MKKRVFAVILGSVMAVSLMACGTKDEGAKDGTKTYTVGISQFAEHGSWITAGKDLSKDSKKPDLKKERTWKSKKRMQLLIREQQNRSVTDLFQMM